MKFLVTGGLGFIGSNFILYVKENFPEFKITNIDAQFYGSNVKNLKDLKNNVNYEYIKGNITNEKLIDKLVSRCDVVFNFAAESHVDRSISNPKPFIDSNILGLYTILESIRKHKKKLIQISTDEVFGSLEHRSADEGYPLKPSSPYSASKASAELLLQSYVKTYNCDAIITRCTNNYGPYQHPEKLIPKVIILAYRNKEIPIYGSGKNVRDWIFVRDHCEAIMKVFFKGKVGESYNIAASNEIDNMTLAKRILKILKKPIELIYHEMDRPGHDFRYSLNSSKIRREIHWKPKHDFERGLEYTVKWYLENLEWWKNIPSRILNLTQWKNR